jgi:long-chain fatty acid transport protein
MFIFIRIFFLLKIVLLLNAGYAAGFQLFEGNAINIGDFGAGGGANLRDASATYFNPAALTNLPCKHQIVIVGTGVFRSSKLNNAIAVTDTISYQLGNPVYTSNQQVAFDNIKSSRVGFIPAIFYGSAIDDNFVFGIGFSVPFGLATDWTNDSYVRYAATQTRIITYNLGPSFAYRVNKFISIGGGIDIQYLDAELNSAVPVPRTITFGGVTGDNFYNQSVNSAHGTSLGGNIGVLVKPMEGFDLSLHYRSRVDHNITGTSKFTGILAPNGTITSEVSTRVYFT